MTEREANQMLEGETLIRALQGAMSHIRKVQEKCLAADIPVALDRCPGTT